MAKNCVLAPTVPALTLPVPAGTRSGDPVLVGGIVGVASTDRAGAAGKTLGGVGHPAGYAAVEIDGAYALDVADAVAAAAAAIYIKNTAPVLNAPTTATTGGTLAAGTYYYKVTAIDASGETIGSNEVSQATTGTTSTVELSWGAVAGATGYKVYRATASGGQSTSPALVATLGAVTSYPDTGTAVSAGAVPAASTTTAISPFMLTTAAAGNTLFGHTVPVVDKGVASGATKAAGAGTVNVKIARI